MEKVNLYLTDFSVRTRVQIAEETKNPDVLDVLSDDPDVNVRMEVAAKEESYCTTLMRLSRDEKWQVLVALLKNPQVEKELFKEVRKSLTKHDNELVSQLAKELVKRLDG